MDTSLERIREKIADLEAKIGNLRIAERELQALGGPAAKPRGKPGPKPKKTPGVRGRKPAAATRTRAPRSGQTIGAAITAVLDQHGSVSAAEIAEHIKTSGRDISNRTVSFALQALKKRGLAKNTDGKWSLPKGRGR